MDPEINDAVEVSPIESEARHQGWVPLDEFRGSETDWIDAETFVKRGKEINPILKKNNERLLRELENQKREMQELRAATEEFKKFQKEQYERKASSLEEELHSLKDQMKQAISSGDGDLAVSLTEKIETIKEEMKQAYKESITETPTQQTVDPIFTEWLSDNSWYSNDVRMAAAANAIGEDVKRTLPWLTGKDFFNALDKALEENFSPSRLGRTSKKQVQTMVEGASTGGSPTRRSGKQSYDSLPAEAKVACDNFVRQRLMTREEYVKEYFS